MTPRRDTRYWPYGRFSSKPQEEGDSRARQDASITAWITRNRIDARLVQQFIFDAGASGFHARHLRDDGGLARFLRSVERGDVRQGDFLLVENLDRLSRLAPTDAQELVLRIINAGVTIAVCESELLVSKAGLNSGDGSLWRLIGEIERAHRESSRKSAMIASSWESKRRAASEGRRTSHKCPRWLRWDDKTRAYVLIPERAQVIREIYRMAWKSGSATITRALNAEPAKYSPFGGKCWTEAYVQKILKERTVLGEVAFSQSTYVGGKRVIAPLGEPVAGYYPAVITEKQWNGIAALRAKRQFWDRGAKLGEVPNILPGRVRCSGCGKACHIRASQRALADGTTRYYRSFVCSGGCGASIAVERVEKGVVLLVMNELSDAMLSASTLVQLDHLRGSIDALDGEAAQLAASIDGWTAALADLNAAGRASVIARINAAHARLAEVDRERTCEQDALASASTVSRDLAMVRAVVKEAMGSTSAQARGRLRSALTTLINKVEVTPGDDSTLAVTARGLKMRVVLLDSVKAHGAARVELGEWVAVVPINV